MGDRNDSTENLKIFLQRFSALYPMVTIKMINVRNDTSLIHNEFYKQEYFFTDRLSLDEFRFNNSVNCETNERFNRLGNGQMWDKILNNYTSPTLLGKIKTLKNEKSIVIYGAGRNCSFIIDKLGLYDVPVKGIAVTDMTKNPAYVKNIAVACIDNYNKNSLAIISVLDKSGQYKIKNDLFEKGSLAFKSFWV